MGELLDLMKVMKDTAIELFRESLVWCFHNCAWNTTEHCDHLKNCTLQSRILTCERLKIKEAKLIEIAKEEWEKERGALI